VLPVLFVPSAISQPRPEICISRDDRENIRIIVLGAFDDALRQHSIKLYDNWLKDLSDQPTRASAGMQNGINAYVRARADALKWLPNEC
jgi:hypothetical protein